MNHAGPRFSNTNVTRPSALYVLPSLVPVTLSKPVTTAVVSEVIRTTCSPSVAPRAIAEQRLLEVGPDVLWLGDEGLAAGAKEQSIARVQLDDRVDVGRREGLGPLLHDCQSVLTRACICRAQADQQRSSNETLSH
jgi:hypothetical protein